MRVGVQYFPSADSISPVQFAVEAEAREFESVFFPDHTHVPVGGSHGWPRSDGVPDYYKTLMDPIVVLGAVAAVTERIRMGSAVCLVPQRDPIILAKQIATIDQLSNGRVLLGVGAGSNAEELHNHGVAMSSRFRVLEERIAAMTAIWTQDEAAFGGEHVSFGALWSWPKPVSGSRPPILLGGTGPSVVDRVVAMADGWMPFRSGMQQVGVDATGEVEDFEEGLAARIVELHRRAADAGREKLPVTLFNGNPHPRAMDRYREMGIDRVIFWVPTLGVSAGLRTLDLLAQLCADSS
ncbi:LLM class F420-dependent oxidoreductase [Nocardia rhamnosiphila]|uniref:LLM class F420-dependent oxidoreductase n=1 Tax=Nocardia rhamnosiphila TaxID=426716 RepID=UPI0033CD4387